MSPFGTESVNREREGSGKPEVLSLNPTQILSEPQIYADFDLLTITQNELNSLERKNFVSINQVNLSIRVFFKLLYCGI